MRTRSLVLLATACLLDASPRADVVRVNNPFGDITIRVVAEDAVRVGGSGRSRLLAPEDVIIRQTEKEIVVECQPPDDAAIDLEIALPYGVEIEAQTTEGSISLEGLVVRADLSTDTGDIALSAPWKATKLELTAEQRPEEFRGPNELQLTPRKGSGKWKVIHHFQPSEAYYGDIRVQARAPRSVVLTDQAIPEDASIKLPWQALEILTGILGAGSDNAGEQNDLDARARSSGGSEVGAVEQGVFRSDVRLVNLMVSVTDRKGRPLLGLGADDFEVLEDGSPQKIASLASEEAPFNLAILLDWSGSTRKDRVAIRFAAQRFVDAARQQDKVAVYALATDVFIVLSRLSADHDRVKSRVQIVPSSPGASPIYDAIVLAYDHELRKHPGERNALIILSDGVDNQIRRTGFSSGTTDVGQQQAGRPSKVSFEDLSRASGLMDALLYPVFLPPKNVSFGVSMGPRRGWGSGQTASTLGGTGSRQWEHTVRDRMNELAKQSGGRMFVAKSIRDLKPIFPRVTDELRSMYSLSYYPLNQNFDGAWRDVIVRVRRPDAVVRTREGYAAK